MNITENTTVGQFAAKHPETARVFDRYRINYCCGGGHSLQEACEKLGLDVKAVQADLQAEIDDSKVGERDWSEASSKDLIEHILMSYHKPLKEELPRLEKLMNKVLKAHGDKAPDVLPELQSVFVALKTELDAHLIKEEEVLFPMILANNMAMISAPVAKMQEEHEAAGDMLKRMREITNNYTLSPDACNSWRALWYGLVELEKALHQHLHLENNVLFVGLEA